MKSMNSINKFSIQNFLTGVKSVIMHIDKPRLIQKNEIGFFSKKLEIQTKSLNLVALNSIQVTDIISSLKHR